MRKLRIITTALFALVLVLFAGWKLYTHFVSDSTPPVISCAEGTLEISVNDGEDALLAGLYAKDARDGDVTENIMVTGVSGLIGSDTAIVSYAAFDNSDNMAVFKRTVRYTDYRKPRFSLSKPMIFKAGGTITIADRVTAEDVLDGNISESVKVTAQDIAVDHEGEYCVTLQVMNSAGDSAVLPLTVIIDNSSAAKELIRLKDYLVYIRKGDPLDPEDYIEDVPGGGSVSIENGLDSSTEGVYEIRYSVSEPDGGSYTVILTVVVE